MIRWKAQLTVGSVAVVVSLAGFCLSPANGSVGGVRQLKNPATGVGSCTLKNSEPKLPVRDAPDLPLAKRHQTYRPDNYDCNGAPLDSRLSEA